MGSLALILPILQAIAALISAGAAIVTAIREWKKGRWTIQPPQPNQPPLPPQSSEAQAGQPPLPPQLLKKKSHPYILIGLLLVGSVLFGQNAVALFSYQRPAPCEPCVCNCVITLTEPKDGQEVPTVVSYRGTISRPDACGQIWGVVHPIGSGYWVQSRALVLGDGTIRGEARFGEAGRHYQEYELLLLAHPSVELHEGQPLDAWPEAAARSVPIKVRKTPSYDR
jgi:hypothetical protein